MNISQKMIGIIGAQGAEISSYFNEHLFAQGNFRAIPISTPPLHSEAHESISLEDCAAVIFLFSAVSGIEPSLVDLWHRSRELYIPSLVAVTDLESSQELDFEDAALIIGRILDPVITPHLILHSDEGLPIALIDIEQLTITRYDLSPIEIQAAESEHNLLVLEFRKELFDKYEEMGREGFENGLLFPAVPLALSQNGLGTQEITHLIEKI